MTYDDYLDHAIENYMQDPEWWEIYVNIQPFLNEDVETKTEALANIERLIDELEEAEKLIRCA